MDALNLYNDKRITTVNGRGCDVSIQRADDLDLSCITFIQELGGTVYAADIGSAGGGQALRMAEAGAWVLAVDVEDYSQQFLSAAESRGVKDLCRYAQGDAANFALVSYARFNIVSSQRMIHYLPFAEARKMLIGIRQSMAPEGRLYLSASGIRSELGNNYAGAGVALQKRYFELDSTMAEKHDIRGNVCLYSEDDFAELLTGCGFQPLSIYSSAFGNVKSVSTPSVS
ncbi:bifunctional 2-polyprenyl-6-hydroxyphenol methylase/3-demethylubiquinol 3-O-methyltransferase UbiG [Herbaspirillum sp. RV1423]|uniref:class I SAM-dependent methyltransferase n=1 Tax=Herbaspirillum sp. RV1423 TaxID=1443993 RepID=UPI0005593DAC|nr:class I SAM-dependent methyltransferase [Herbaspirillum sp. RV1423]